MFNVDGMTISMTIGDTGAIRISATGYTFTSNDRALFSIKSGNGSVIIEKPYEFDEENGFLVCFPNELTQRWPAGGYRWDVRFVINAHFDASGHLADGDQIITPYPPQQFNLLDVVGTI